MTKNDIQPFVPAVFYCPDCDLEFLRNKAVSDSDFKTEVIQHLTLAHTTRDPESVLRHKGVMS